MTTRPTTEPLEQRRMLFAHALVVDAKATQRDVAVTDSYVYYERLPKKLDENDLDGGRTLDRVEIKSGKARSILPASGASWKLRDLTGMRAISRDTVLISFSDGTLWAARDGASTATKIADVNAASLGNAVILNGSLFFFAWSADGSYQLAASDGTRAGTRIVPGLTSTTGIDPPKSIAVRGSDLFFVGYPRDANYPQLLESNGTSVAQVPAMKDAGLSLDGMTVAGGRVVVVSDHKLYVLSDDLTRYAAVATSRAPHITAFGAVGNGLGLVSDNGIFVSDLTTRGTVRIADAPTTSFGEFDADLGFDSAGYLLDAYVGETAVRGNGVNTDVPSSVGPAVYRLTAGGLKKVLDGSFNYTRHLAGATYFFDSNDTIPGGVVARVDNADDRTSTLATFGDAFWATSGRRALAFAGNDGTLYAIDPADATGAIAGTVRSDTNLNRKLNGSDKPVTSGTAFADYNRNGKLDAGEPSSPIGAGTFRQGAAGAFTITGVRAGKADVVVTLGSNFRGVAARQVTVAAHDVVTTSVLATPRVSTIRVEVFDDVDGDGVRDKHEGGVAGYTAFLDVDNDGDIDPGDPTRTTDGDGVATFTRLAPGLFRVRVAHADDGKAFTTPAYFKVRTAPDGTQTVAVGVHADPKTASIAGRLTSLTASPHFGSVTVELYRGATKAAEVLSTTSGHFEFDHLLSGGYTVQIRAEGRYAPTIDPPVVATSAGAQSSVKLQVRVDPIVVGIVYADTNGNGVFDAGERRIADASISGILRGSSTAVTATSNAIGVYELILPLPVDTIWDGQVGLTSTFAAGGAGTSVAIGETFGTEINGEYDLDLKYPGP